MEWKLIEDYFKKYNTSSLQIESYNSFVETLLPQMITGTSFKVVLPQNQLLVVYFGNIYIEKPYIYTNHQKPVVLFPEETRLRDLSYEAVVHVDIFTSLVNTITNDVIEKQTLPYVNLMKIPVMVRSKLCNLPKSTDFHNECDKDYGGYFIIRGKERVLIAQERITYNHIYVYGDKKSSKFDHFAEIRSTKEDAGSVLIRAKIINEIILVSLPYIQVDIPLGIVLKAIKLDGGNFLKLFKDFPYMTPFVRNSINNFKDLSYVDCINYIGKYTINRIQDSKRFNYTIQLLENEILPHLGLYASIEEVGDFLALIIFKLLQTIAGKRPIDDRDHVCNKRIEMTGHLIGNLLRTLFKKFIKSTQQRMEKKQDLNIIGAIQRFNISQRLYHCFSTGNWGVQKSKYIRQGVSQILNRLSYNATVSHLRRVIIPIGKDSKNTQVRQLHSSTYGFTDAVETPEGSTSGIVKAFSMLVKITNSIPSVIIQDVVSSMSSFIPIGKRDLSKCGIFINGNWIGSIETSDATSYVCKLRALRETHMLDRSISIGWDRVDNEIHIHSDEGRIIRPVFNVCHPKFPQLKEDWDDMIEEGLIVMVDGYEVDFEHIAMWPKDIIPETSFLEIHPSLLLGTCSNLIPFINHSQAPRNLYSSSMMKQSIGMYNSSFNTRFDNTAHILHYPQKRLVTTKYSTMCGMEDNPSGINAIVAIGCYTGFNMEDSILINKSAIDRGMFHSTVYKTVSTSESKRGTHGNERIELPPENIRNNSLDYSCLGSDGIVLIGSQVKANSVLVGKVYYKSEVVERDTSLVCCSSEAGIVDSIASTFNASGYLHIKVKIRSTRIPEVGDKLASLEGQKGTTGAIVPQEDMPFTANGMVCDLLVNSHCIPSQSGWRNLVTSF
jgi:DNA-directed RNA polymerase II subunit RPB2